MAIEFKLPQVAEGVETADVAELMVAEGDQIEAGQVVLEVETEKAVAEIECPHGGRVAKVHVSEGQTVRVGDVLLTIEEAAADATPAPAAPATPAAAVSQPATPDMSAADISQADTAAPAAAVTTSGAAEEASTGSPERPTAETGPAPAAAAATPEVSPAKTASRPTTATAPPPPPSSTPAAATAPASAAESKQAADARATEAAHAAAALPKRAAGAPEERPPAPAGPATRRLARQLGVDLYQVPGSGPGGRITEDDVKAFVRERMSAPAGAVVGGITAPPLPDFSQFGPIERQPLGKIGQTAAAHLSVAWQVIPHVTQHDLADITELEAARRRYSQSQPPDSPKITLTVVVMKAVVAALKAFPQFNASLDPRTNELILKRYYHIGCAVDTPHGLLVPVVRDVDQKSLRQVAAELTELAERARERKLELQQMQGASFTITNLGGIAGTAFTPIVNYPEVAILGISRTRTELRRSDDGRIQERLMLPLSLSYDHRVINGADGARFLAKVCQDLSDVFRMVAES